MPHLYEREIGGHSLAIEVGRLAGQANGAVTVRYGDTVVLVTACVSSQIREGVDFLPLPIAYEERLYAAGKIPGGWFRREGRPSAEAVLAARLTDRPLRPLFPKGFRTTSRSSSPSYPLTKRTILTSRPLSAQPLPSACRISPSTRR